MASTGSRKFSRKLLPQSKPAQCRLSAAGSRVSLVPVPSCTQDATGPPQSPHTASSAGVGLVGRVVSCRRRGQSRKHHHPLHGRLGSSRDPLASTPSTSRHLNPPPPVTSLAIGRSPGPHLGLTIGEGDAMQGVAGVLSTVLLPPPSLVGAVIGSGSHRKGAAIGVGVWVGFVWWMHKGHDALVAWHMHLISAASNGPELGLSRHVNPSSMKGLGTYITTRHRHADPLFYFCFGFMFGAARWVGFRFFLGFFLGFFLHSWRQGRGSHASDRGSCVMRGGADETVKMGGMVALFFFWFLFFVSVGVGWLDWGGCGRSLALVQKDSRYTLKFGRFAPDCTWSHWWFGLLSSVSGPRWLDGHAFCAGIPRAPRGVGVSGKGFRHCHDEFNVVMGTRLGQRVRDLLFHFTSNQYQLQWVFKRVWKDGWGAATEGSHQPWRPGRWLARRPPPGNY
ncbi:hypothetical protein QBC39DRAFT_34004 [Podospora conica]|nr:hypothetical protein QBC39DRAFT_34004 [Schizothecium conicum]